MKKTQYTPEQERFEFWALANNFETDLTPANEYVSPETRIAWKAWQAGQRPVAPVSAEALHAECKRVAHNAIHDAIYKIDDCEPVKDAVRDALDSIDLSEFAAADDAKDAARWRWLRTFEGDFVSDELDLLAYLPTGDDLDVLIDAESQAHQKPLSR